MSGTNYEFSAKSVDAAIADGLRQLGLSRNEVEIDVLHEGSRGLLGIGSSNARVRITVPPKVAAPAPEKPAPAPPPAPAPAPEAAQAPTAADVPVAEPTPSPATDSTPPTAAEPVAVEEKPAAAAAQPAADDTVAAEDSKEEGHGYDDDEGQAYDGDVNPDDLAELASGLLLELLEHMGFEADVEASWTESQSESAPLTLNVIGGNLGMLIGRHGETLASIQYLIRLMVNQRIHRWTNIVVDVDGYKARRAEQLLHMAERMAEQVLQTGRAVALEPMPANERRLVHIALRNHTGVYTESIGEADRRKVQILPK